MTIFDKWLFALGRNLCYRLFRSIFCYNIMKKLFLGFFLCIALFMPITSYSATQTDLSYTTLRSVDTGTFNEFRYKITEQFFVLRDKWEINNELHKKTLENIGVLANTGYEYLPDNLQNKNLLKKLLTDLQRWVKFPNNDSNYTEIIKSISNYLDNANIETIKWRVQVSPIKGNAPLNVTLRWDVTDPTGTQIPQYNYTWWVDRGGERVVIGRGISLNYTFTEEGNFSVFLDVTSNHKNENGNIDVLPFRSRANIEVEEKIASLIIKVNGNRLGNADGLKFTPQEAGYGLIFDITSSTPTGGARFVRTEWDFGNGLTREYVWFPRVERVVYAREWDYTVTLRLRTNELKSIERQFIVSINDPVATISSSQDDGFAGDKFTLTAKPSGNDKNLSYGWEIIDIDNDAIISRSSEKLFTHSFSDKWKYNVKLKITEASGQVDVDTKLIYINSKPPVAEFTSRIPLSNKPNRVFLDGSRSFDPDLSDDGKLTYTWYIDGQRVNLEDANSNGSVGYYVFDSVGSHDVNLEVRDPDNIVSIKKSKVQIDSILSVEMFAFPRVIQRESFIRFVAESPEAEIFEWDFGDGIQQWGNKETINHTFNKSGAFDVRLRVRDADNKQNTFIKTVYVGESDRPVAVLDLTSETELLTYSDKACSGKGWYTASRVSAIKFDANDSINIDGENSGIDYTWKIWNSKFATSAIVNHRFDEIGCFPVKLTVKSQKNGKSSTRTVNVDVVNKVPTLTSLDINIQNEEADPLVVTVDALWAKDEDGVIQSYLWYYYTDTDSEPQDFRSSTKPSTTFVLPKITGQYYFVVILKDNNEARVTSEEITGSRFFTTVTGDNINTPLVDMSVNDNSVAIGDEVVFNTQVKDILGQNVAKNSKFSWDFDGDGFYDIEGTEGSISYKYKKSWTFYAKVKVKHKGISTTKNVTVNVSNKIVPDFEYISIGNKYVFFDTSNGELDSREWDLGDGTKVSGKTFVHEYADKKSVHNVKLKVSEGTRTKDVEKKVTKNIKNVLGARGQGLNLFTIPAINSSGSVVLEQDYERLYIYTWESRGDIASYAIDYDIIVDADLNGGKDDDEDNKGTGSYNSGDVLEIPLNPLRTQDIRIFLLWEDGNVIDSQDISIVKSYIEEQNIDLQSIEFLNVTDSEKAKIQELKDILSTLPQAQKLVAMNFVQRMQESWSDETEKTRVIIEFETHLFDQDIANTEEIVQILESLLVEGQADQSEKNVAFNALKNLIPESINCEIGEWDATCYSMLIAKLETIHENDNVEENKTLGSSILRSIQDTDTMTNQQKLDFKAILSSLIYGGLANIPESEVQEVIETPQENSGGWWIIGVLVIISYILGTFLSIFLGVLLVFFLWYKLSGSGKDMWFQEFITHKTSLKKSNDESPSNEVKTDNEDILSDEQPISTKEVETKEAVSEDIPDPLGGEVLDTSPSSDDVPQASDTKDAPQALDSDSNDQVPDWLSGNFGDASEAPSTESKTQDPLAETPSDAEIDQATKIEETDVPDWLQADVKQESKTEAKEEKTTVDTTDSNESIPDWLSGSLDADTEKTEKSDDVEVSKPKQDTVETKQEKTKEAPQDLQQTDTTATLSTDEDSSASDDSIPDWLSGSFDDTDAQEADDDTLIVDVPEKKVKKPKQGKKSAAQETTEKAAKKDTSNSDKKDSQKSTSSKKTPVKQDKKASPKKTATPKKKTDTKQAVKKKPAIQEKSTPKAKKESELWDDGMKVPDWLKSSDE